MKKIINIRKINIINNIRKINVDIYYKQKRWLKQFLKIYLQTERLKEFMQMEKKKLFFQMG